MGFISWCTLGLVLGCGVLEVSAGTTDYPLEMAGDAMNNNHLSATLDRVKLEMNVFCLYDELSSELSFVVHEADTNLIYTGVGPDEGERVEFELCYFIDALAFDTDRSLDESSCDRFHLTVASNSRTHHITITLGDDCGKEEPTNGGISEYVYGVYCMRKEDYIKQFDYVFMVHVRADGAECVADSDSYTFNVGQFQNTSIFRRYGTTFDVYRTYDPDSTPVGPKTPDDDNPAELITAGYTELGRPLFLEGCVVIPTSTGGSGLDHNHQYFDDEYGVIGISIQECWAYGGYNPVMLPSQGIKVLKNRCGLAENIVGWPTDRNIWSYVPDDEESTQEYERSPNCFRSLTFEAASFTPTIIGDNSEVIIECYVEYCFDLEDPDCWEEAECPFVEGRKKRESNSTKKRPSGLPSTFRAKFKIAPEKQKAEPSCSEWLELITITSVISTLLLILIVAASFMMFHIQSLGTNTVIELDNYGRVVGKQNMGYQ